MSEGITHLLDGVANREVSGGDVVALKKFLSKALAGFELGRRSGRTENGPFTAIELVHNAQG